MMKNYKQKIAYSANWALPVFLDEDNNVYYSIPNTVIKLPFVTDDNYEIIDLSHDLKNIVAKLKLSQMQIDVLKKKIDANYSSEYLDKYFSELKGKVPEFENVQFIVSKYKKFTSEFFKKSIWSEEMNHIRSKEISHIEKDKMDMELFMEYLKES